MWCGKLFLAVVDYEQLYRCTCALGLSIWHISATLALIDGLVIFNSTVLLRCTYVSAILI